MTLPTSLTRQSVTVTPRLPVYSRASLFGYSVKKLYFELSNNRFVLMSRSVGVGGR